MTYHLAIDVGASSGRFILGHVENNKIKLQEIYRFENGIVFDGQYYVWDLEGLFNKILLGLKKCYEINKIPQTIAIDTWGVDYVLLDDEKEILPCVSYRDNRTQTVLNDVFKLIPQNILFTKTGIQNYNYNTLFQLFCDKNTNKLFKATNFLMMPEYLSYKLTNVKKHEYTICSTTGILNAENRDWDTDVIKALGFNERLFTTPVSPSSKVGQLTKEIQKIVGFNSDVIFCPSHDTASAVCACPLDDNSLFISSGTWSLVGTENPTPILTDDCFRSGLSNEGGINNRIRLLKNIMGMWIFQSIRKELECSLSYDEMMQLAQESKYTKTFDPSDNSFLNPKSMIDAIKNYLEDENLSLGDVLNSAYHSLAKSYFITLNEIESLTSKKINKIIIVGGGSKDKYLNRLTEEYTSRPVIIGPTEGSALGNIISQILYSYPNLTLDYVRKNMI